MDKNTTSIALPPKKTQNKIKTKQEQKIPQVEGSRTKERQIDFGGESKLGVTDQHGMNSPFFCNDILSHSCA